MNNIRYCRDILSQARGLMFRKKQNLVMEFPTERKVSLHMFFVFYPIDVLVLDSSKKIAEIASLQPWTFWKSSKKGKYIVETPFKHEYKVGEKVKV
jgi:uncharacterized protein